MDKINVSLYGGKSIFKGVRETPLEADVIYCDHYKRCDLFKEGKCLHKREVGDRGRKCIYGKVEKYQGYTSRAKKYWSFRTRFTNDAVYEKLDRAGDVRVARIGDYIYLNTSYLHVKIENGKIVTLETAYSAYYPQGRVFIPKEVFSEDILYQILSFVPHSMVYNEEIKQYKNKVVPEIIDELRKKFKFIYTKLITKHPELDVAPNYVGRYAYIKTMRDGSILSDNGNKFVLQNGELICEDFRMNTGLFYKAEKVSVRITVSDTQTYKITDNSQCDDNTKFR